MKKVNLSEKKPLSFKGNVNNALKDFKKKVLTYSKKNKLSDKPEIKTVASINHGNDKFVTYRAVIGDVTIEADYQSGKTLKEGEDDMGIMDNIEAILYQRAHEKIEANLESMKDDFVERQEKIDIAEAKRIFKFHAKGGKTRHKKAKSEGEKSILTGKSKAKRRLQGIKTHKTAKRMTGSAKMRKQKKIAKAKKKRGSR